MIHMLADSYNVEELKILRMLYKVFGKKHDEIHLMHSSPLRVASWSIIESMAFKNFDRVHLIVSSDYYFTMGQFNEYDSVTYYIPAEQSSLLAPHMNELKDTYCMVIDENEHKTDDYLDLGYDQVLPDISHLSELTLIDDDLQVYDNMSDLYNTIFDGGYTI